jgi:hypothetical protein
MEQFRIIKFKYLFDVSLATFGTFLLFLSVYSQFFYHPEDVKTKIYVTIKVPVENIEMLLPAATSLYLNGVNKTVEFVSQVKKSDFLYVTLRGPGYKKGDIFVLNGQRILVNQKAELHSTMIVQGFVTELSDVSK